AVGDLKAKASKVAGLSDREADAYREAGKLVQSLLDAYLDLIGVVEERDGLVEEAEPLLTTAQALVEAGTDEKTRTAATVAIHDFDPASVFPIQPVPLDFSAFIRNLVEVA